MITLRQWELVNYCEQFWHTFKAFPPVATVLENLDEYYIDISDIKDDLESNDVKAQFKARGIDIEIKNDPAEKRGRIIKRKGLTQEQTAAVHTILNPADTRSIPRKLEELGISSATFNGWLKNPDFMTYYKKQAEDMLNDGIPVAHTALMGQVMRGNTKAIEFLYKLTGYYTGAESEELMNMKIFIHKIVEIMQTHIDDPATLKLITREMLSLLGMGDNQMEDVMNSPSPPLQLEVENG